jgi:hypothetical protein
MYVDSLRPSVVSFDFYPFFANNTIRRDYFYSLSLLVSHSGNAPVWCHPMTTGHLAYGDPTPAQLRFMYYAPLGSGVKGFVAFTYARPRSPDYRESLITDDGVLTSRGQFVASLQNYIKTTFAPVIMTARLLEVYHQTPYPNQDAIVPVTSASHQRISRISDERLMASRFLQERREYLVVVNKSLSDLGSSTLELRGTATQALLAPRQRPDSHCRWRSIPRETLPLFFRRWKAGKEFSYSFQDNCSRRS